MCTNRFKHFSLRGQGLRERERVKGLRVFGDEEGREERGSYLEPTV